MPKRTPAYRLLNRAYWAVLAVAVLWLPLASAAHAANAVTVHCGQIITTDTKLANDLTDCPGNGIVIGAPGITLDLNGHTIDGDGVPRTDCRKNEPCDGGVVNTASKGERVFLGPGHNGVTIENGSIREFVEGGVYALGVSDNRVRDLSISETGDGVLITRSANSSIENVSSVDNRFYGIVVSSCARCAPSHDIRVEHNVVSGNVLGGIFVDFSERVIIAGNLASNSQDGDAITVTEGSHHVIRGNSAVGSPAGIGVAISDHTLVAENSVHDNRFAGVYVQGGDDNRIEANSIIDNGDGSEAGIHILSDWLGGTSERNTLTSNVVSGNVGDGVLVDAGQTQTLITRNRTDDNSDDGIDVDESATTLTANIANRNHDLGIEAVAGVTDGGGNKASANGNPLQCVHVLCK